MSEKPFAEIIESSLHNWKAQSWKWDEIPAFGSLVAVRTKVRTIFGIVYNIRTGSLDPVRIVIAYQKTEEELKKEQPQIFEFLHTTFDCLTLGYLQNGVLLYQLAPEPPKIHCFVTKVQLEEIIKFFSSEYYLHLLFNSAGQLFLLDELLLALLKNLSDLGVFNHKSLEKFIQTFSLFTANDYRRLKLFLQRASCVLKQNHIGQ